MSILTRTYCLRRLVLGESYRYLRNEDISKKLFCYSASVFAAADNQQHKHRPTVDTLDEAEINRFNKLAEKWWDTSGPLRTLHQMNELRVPLVRDALRPDRDKNIEKCLEGKWIVDVGCGGGILSEPLARLGAFVLGLDAGKDGIDVAQRHAKTDPEIAHNIKYVHGVLEDLVLTECEKFDAVVASEVIEHVTDQQNFVKMCCDLVKPGGMVIMSTINKTPLSYALGIIAAEYILGTLPKGTHEYEKFIPIEELKKSFVEYGMDIKLVHGLVYNPITERWSWSSCKEISYAIVAQKRLIETDSVS
ncbi:ubiquinone biosynthesis O-methyltransferase-like [Tubulanus polymorphus]|uniref:ubiquinone biosynthesis O-methyltransferase-like n=1 Tax=Tubulanus polymorphus TaxID=672921 RepID=UPI003DA28EAA